MTTTIVRGGTLVAKEASAEKGLNMVEKLVLRSAHPVSIFLQMVGWMWAVFFIWNHLWVEAVLSYFLCRVAGLAVVSRSNANELAQTMMGKIALLHLYGSNLFVQLIGVAMLVFGVWTHEVRIILTGGTVLLLGHIQGWGKVDARFKTP